MNGLRAGLIGAGAVARRHLDVLAGFGDVRVVAAADTALDRAEAVARPLGATAYADWREMLGAERLDLLWLCVPPFARGAPERAAVELGLPFFVEKPLSVDLATSEAVAAAVAGRGLLTAVGYHWRYMDTVELARSVLRERPARLINGYWLDSTPPARWWGRRAASGGQVNEQTTHIFDLARWLVGEVEEVYAAAARAPRAGWPEVDVEEVSSATLKFESGAVGAVSSTCLLGWPHRIGLNLFGDDLAIELTQGEVGVYGAPGTTERVAGVDPVALQDRAFVDAVKGGGPDRIRCTYADALRTQRLTAAAARSAVTGRPERPDATPVGGAARA